MTGWIVCCGCVLMLVAAAESKKLLDPPRKLSARSLTPRSVEVRWRDPGSKGRARVKTPRTYTVRFGVVDQRDTRRTIVTYSRKATLSDLTPDTLYEIEVKVARGRRSSPWSKTVKVRTGFENEEQSVVRNLTATAMTSEAVQLSWQPPANLEGVAGYTVLSQLASGVGKLRKALLKGEVRSHTVEKLRPFSLYTFRVQTVMKAEGSNPTSERVTARTSSARPSRPPRELTLTPINGSSIQVSWLPPPQKYRNGILLGYKLRCRRKGASGRGDISNWHIQRGVRKYLITDLPGNMTYHVKVSAFNMDGSGPYTKWRSVYLRADGGEDVAEKGTSTVPPPPSSTSGDVMTFEPSPPPSVTVVNMTGSGVHLEWLESPTPPCCPVYGYSVKIRNLNDSSTFDVVTGRTNTRLDNLDPETLYGVKVTTFVRSGASKPSEEIFFTTPPAAPPKVTLGASSHVTLGGDANMTCQARSNDKTTFTWYLRAGASKVKVSQHYITELEFAQKYVVTSRETGPGLVTSSLLLQKVTTQEDVTFECEARNSAGADSRLLPMVVYDPPRITVARGTTVMAGTPSRLLCRAEGKPKPDILWVHPGSDSVYQETFPESNPPPSVYAISVVQPNAAQGRQSYLILRSASLRHAGQYTCVARSTAGRDERKVQLDVKVPPPPAVSKIQAIALSPTRVSVTWIPPSNYTYRIVYYQVTHRRKDGGEPIYTNSTRTGMEITGLMPASEYLVGVTAVSQDSSGQNGPEVEVTTLTNVGLEPSNVTAVAVNSSVIQLNWAAPRGVDPMFIRGYEIQYRKENSSEIKQLFVRGNGSKKFLIVGLGSSHTYYLRISTRTTWGHASRSEWIRIQPMGFPTVPGKPRKFTAFTEEDTVTLTWERPAVRGQVSKDTALMGYQVDYGPFSNPGSLKSRRVVALDNQLTLHDLQAKTKYLISIRAYNRLGSGEPVYSTVHTKDFPPSMVQRVKATAVSSTEIHLQWSPPARGRVSRYHIRYWRPGRKDKQSARLSGTFRNYVAGSLRKNSNYRFEIIPYSGDRLGEGVVIFAQTLPDKPDGPPTNVLLRAINSSALVASWSPPSADKANGRITGYRLVLRTKGGPRLANFAVAASKSNFTFLDMDVSQPYRLRIAAMNVNGTGVFSPWIESTFSNNPRAPNSPGQLRITAGENFLKLHWGEPAFSGSPVQGYVVGFGQFIPEVYRKVISNAQRNFTIKRLKPDSEYIVSVRAFNKIGESAAVYAIARTQGVSAMATPLLPPVGLRVESHAPTSLMLSWADPAMVDPSQPNVPKELADGRAYMIRFSPLSGEEYSYRNTTSRSLELTDLDPATLYEVSIKTVRGTNHSTWSLSVLNSTQQIAPSSAPGNITVSPVNWTDTEVNLNWTEPVSVDGKIEEYIIYLTSDPKPDTQQWIMMKTQVRQVRIRDLEPHVTYYFKLQARNLAGFGPLSETVVYTPPTDSRAAPSNVAVSGLESRMNTAVRVSWQLPEAPLGPITGYVIYFSDQPGVKVSDWEVQEERGLDIVLLGLALNTTYYFKIRARYADEIGPMSEVVNYTTSEDDQTIPRPQVDTSARIDRKDKEREKVTNRGFEKGGMNSGKRTGRGKAKDADTVRRKGRKRKEGDGEMDEEEEMMVLRVKSPHVDRERNFDKGGGRNLASGARQVDEGGDVGVGRVQEGGNGDGGVKTEGGRDEDGMKTLGGKRKGGDHVDKRKGEIDNEDKDEKREGEEGKGNGVKRNEEGDVNDDYVGNSKSLKGEEEEEIWTDRMGEGERKKEAMNKNEKKSDLTRNLGIEILELNKPSMAGEGNEEVNESEGGKGSREEVTKNTTQSGDEKKVEDERTNKKDLAKVRVPRQYVLDDRDGQKDTVRGMNTQQLPVHGVREEGEEEEDMDKDIDSEGGWAGIEEEEGEGEGEKVGMMMKEEKKMDEEEEEEDGVREMEEGIEGNNTQKKNLASENDNGNASPDNKSREEENDEEVEEEGGEKEGEEGGEEEDIQPQEAVDEGKFPETFPNSNETPLTNTGEGLAVMEKENADSGEMIQRPTNTGFLGWLGELMTDGGGEDVEGEDGGDDDDGEGMDVNNGGYGVGIIGGGGGGYGDDDDDGEDMNGATDDDADGDDDNGGVDEDMNGTKDDAHGMDVDGNDNGGVDKHMNDDDNDNGDNDDAVGKDETTPEPPGQPGKFQKAAGISGVELIPNGPVVEHVVDVAWGGSDLSPGGGGDRGLAQGTRGFGGAGFTPEAGDGDNGNEDSGEERDGEVSDPRKVKGLEGDLNDDDENNNNKDEEMKYGEMKTEGDEEIKEEEDDEEEENPLL